jgi:kynurenine 3-monooxygenase
MTSSKHILIIGAGLAGTLMACYLAQMGHRVRIYERRGDPRARGYVGGRSINLALSSRGFHGLAGVGLDKLVMERDAIPMHGRMIHPPGGGPLVFQPYSANPADAINSVSRGGLNLTLLSAADAFDGVEFIFDHPCIDVDLEGPAAVFETAGRTVRVEADLVIGADGAFSAARGRMQKTDRFEYSQSYLEHGYKELHIPPRGADPAGEGGTDRSEQRSLARFAMEPRALHIWPRGGAMMIALPNRDSSFTCTLFWPFEGEHGFASLDTPDDVRGFFEQHYLDAVPLMPRLVEDFFRNPTSSLVTVRCWPWQIGGKVVLIGDAAHAIVPFYGQGMNAAFEDCRALADCLSRHSNQADALHEYQVTRKPNADAIAEMALENFIEMRDKVGDPDFLYKKRVEQMVHAAFPDRVMPQYNLVSFSTVPYVEARRRGRHLDAVLERIIEALPRHIAGAMADEHWKTEIVRIADAQLRGTPGEDR